MSLSSNILPLDNILLDVDASSKKRIFEQVGLLLEEKQDLSQEDVFDCLFSREKLGSTGLGQGVAIPHGRYAGLKKPFGVFFRTLNPIDFDAPDGKPVDLIFVLLVPESATSEHLAMLSHLAEVFSSKDKRLALRSLHSVEDVQTLLLA